MLVEKTFSSVLRDWNLKYFKLDITFKLSVLFGKLAILESILYTFVYVK